ncbi:MAG: hypothetical protein LH461_08690 [Spirochaetaceae bacterium]|nr:hypothetical protein [Spirochaetaceae bacterium]
MAATADPPAPSADDAKLLTLARAVRSRTGAAEAVAARDDLGRTYVASNVELPSLRLSAVEVIAAVALSSGTDRLDTVLVLGGSGDLSDDDRRVLDDLSVTTVLFGDD